MTLSAATCPHAPLVDAVQACFGKVIRICQGCSWSGNQANMLGYLSFNRVEIDHKARQRYAVPALLNGPFIPNLCAYHHDGTPATCGGGAL